MTASSIRPVRAKDQRSALAALTVAFSSDPMMRWLYPGPALYLRHFPGLLKVYGGRAFASRTAWQVDRSVAVALWLPPGTDVDGEAFVDLLLHTIAPEQHEDVVSTVEQMDRAHPAMPVWYLALLGVDAAMQGRGLGGELIDHGLEIVDRDHLPAYLDSTNPRNVPFYERHGFEVVGEARSGVAPPIILMLRQPR